MDERTKPLNLPNHSKSQYVTRVPDVASSGLVLGKTLIHIIRKLHGSSDIWISFCRSENNVSLVRH